MAKFERLRFSELERDGGVLTVRLCRPELQNALNGPANDELARVFDEFAADAGLGVAILTGSGSSFCVGSEEPADPLPQAGFGGLTLRAENPKPVIAAVNGNAENEGFELALACDLIVASEDACFAVDQGRFPGHLAAQRLGRLSRELPVKRRAAAFLAGKAIPAPEGVLLGFVNELSSRADVMSVANGVAKQILSTSGRTAFVPERAVSEAG